MQRVFKIAENIYKIKLTYGLKPKPLKCAKPTECFDAVLSSFELDDLLALQEAVSKEIGATMLEGSDVNKITFFAAVHAMIEPYRVDFVNSFSTQNWQKSRCPFCGSKAGLGNIKDTGVRKLICHFCWTEWEYPRTKCFDCGEEILNYSLFEVSGRDVRVDFCESCKSYLKTVIFEHSEEPYVLWDLKTLSLDDWAASKGYKKPTPSLVGIDFTK